MSSKTLVVLAAVYNESKYIEEAIESFINQNKVNAKLVIIDDISEDNTYQIAKKYETENIIVFKNPKKGKNNAYNFGYENVKGDYYCFFGGDDILTKNSLAARVDAAQKSLEKKVALKARIKTFSEDKKFDGVVMPKNNKKGNNSGGAVMISKELAADIFPIPTTLPNEDGWTGLHIDNFAEEIVVIDDIVLNYRIHANNSVGISLPFHIRTEKIHKRRKVYQLFLNAFGYKVDKDQVARIENIIKLESSRYNRNFFAMLFKNKASIVDKIAAIFHFNSFLYKCKNIIYKLVTGIR